MAALAKVPNIKPISIPNIDLSAIKKAHANALAVFPEIQKQFAAQQELWTELQRKITQIALPAQATLDRMAELAKRAEALIPKPSPEQVRLFDQLAKADRRKQALDRLGVLPHPSTPFTLLDADDTDDILRSALERHYRDNWGKISQDIRDRAEQFDIDEEAKAALAESLAAHQNGHYRSVCRLLLPEIERVARVELLGNDLGTIKVDKVIGEPGMELSISQTNPPGFYALGLYQRLTDHIYVRVDASNREKLESDPVPNRHAAIHGLIVYNSFWHSLNCIFMTDFAFQVVSAVKRLGSEE
ncbi:hypothetical protein ACVWXL_008130 [Bradyrhizobium sp. GM22.5]